MSSVYHKFLCLLWMTFISLSLSLSTPSLPYTLYMYFAVMLYWWSTWPRCCSKVRALQSSGQFKSWSVWPLRGAQLLLSSDPHTSKVSPYRILHTYTQFSSLQLVDYELSLITIVYHIVENFGKVFNLAILCIIIKLHEKEVLLYAWNCLWSITHNIIREYKCMLIDVILYWIFVILFEVVALANSGVHALALAVLFHYIFVSTCCLKWSHESSILYSGLGH